MIEWTSIDHIVTVILSAIVTEFDRELTISAVFDYKIDTILYVILWYGIVILWSKRGRITCRARRTRWNLSFYYSLLSKLFNILESSLREVVHRSRPSKCFRFCPYSKYESTLWQRAPLWKKKKRKEIRKNKKYLVSNTYPLGNILLIKIVSKYMYHLSNSFRLIIDTY